MRLRDVDLLAGAVGVSALGDFLAFVPLVLHVQGHGGSGLAVAAVGIALFAPAALLARPAGRLADRLESRSLLRALSLAQAAAALALALAFDAGMVPLLALTALVGAGTAFAQPPEFALVPSAAAGTDLARANGRIEAARNLGYLAGPLLGGLIAAAGDTREALLLDAASFLGVAVAAQALRARRHPAAVASERESAAGGLRALFAAPELGRVVGVAFAALLFMTASAPAEVFFAKEVLHGGDAGYGALMTLWTGGMVIGSLALAPRIAPGRRGRAALALIVLQGAGLFLPTLWLVLPFALVAYLGGGVGHGAKNVVVRTLIHTRVADEVRGRAWAAYNAGRNGAELVALTGGGLMVGAFGARTTLLLAGALPIAAVGATTLRRPRRAAVEFAA